MTLKEDLNNLASEVDRQMKDAESRILSTLSHHIEEANFQTNAKMDEALLMLD